MPRKKQEYAALSYAFGDEKLWYSRSDHVESSYVQCFLSAQELKEQGILAIPHSVKSKKVWSQLLQGKLPPPTRHALVADTDCAMPLEDQESASDIEAEGRIDLEDALAAVLAGDSEHSDSAEASAPASDDDDGGRPPSDGGDGPPGGGADAVGAGALAMPAAGANSAPLAAEKTYWGHFRLSRLVVLPQRPFGAFEASCPYHKKNEKTNCKRSSR